MDIADHGVPVPSDETRTAAVCRRGSAAPLLVIAAKGYLLVVDLQTEQCRQARFPSGRADYPYACFAASDGTLYTGAGTLFMAFDPFACEYVHTASVEGGNAGYSFAEDGRGRVWFSVQGSCELLRYDPAARKIERFGQADAEEAYPATMAVDDAGWVYVGIGTARRNVVGLMPDTGEWRRFAPPEQRTIGAGYVFRALDGRVYGHFESGVQVGPHDPSHRWHLFENGEARPVPFDAVAPSPYTGSGFRRVHGRLPEPWKLRTVDLAERRVTIVDRTGARPAREIALSYHSEGAQLSALAVGADGRLYGTSGHPLHLYRHDPATGQTADFGGDALEEAGSGNICAYARLGSALYGALYPGGILHRIDTAAPFRFAPGPDRNPRIVARCPEAYRPRCCLAHPDGRRVLFGGYAGYGEVGGGLGVYDTETETGSVVPNARLVPGQSFVTLAADEQGAVFGGTCVNTPGGGRPVAEEGCLAQLDPESLRVLRTWTPLPKARSLTSLVAAGGSRLLAMSAAGAFAVFDTRLGETVAEADLSAWGAPVGHAILPLPGGGYCVLTRERILRYDPATHEFHTLAALPAGQAITRGGALLRGRLFFASGARLLSVGLPSHESKP